MKKYTVYKNGLYMASYSRRFEAEQAIREAVHQEKLQAIRNQTSCPCNTYDIRR